MMMPDVSAVIAPIVALNFAVVVPEEIVTLAGTVIRGELEDRATAVLIAGGCDSVTVQALVAPDIRPAGLQTSEVTVREAASETVNDRVELL